MNTRPLVAALVFAFAPATLPAMARAQAPAEDATTAMARARFKEGVDFYDKGDFEQARASFLQAYALKKHPAVLLNLAWSCVKSGHALEAERYFKQFLTDGKDITEKQRADANDGLTQSRAKLGRIEISATAGTEVTVDGEKVGTAPLGDPIAVEAGAHTVNFKGPDGATDTQSVTVLGGENAIARFGKSAAAGGAPAPPDATATPPTPPPDANQNQTTGPAPTPGTPETAGGKNLLSPPRNIIPAVVLGAVAVAGYVVAGVLLASKNKAQNEANTTANEIVTHGGGSSTCTAQGVAAAPQFIQACNAYITDTNQVNQDATAGNVAVGVGIAATVGFVIYYLAADKGASSTVGVSTPVVGPLVGRSLGGLSLSASF